MKILYGIQGTGNGHISRAQAVIPHLLGYGELDILISGSNYSMDLNYPVKYYKSGLSYSFGRNGGIDLIDSARNMNLLAYLEDVKSLPAHQYDLILSDFEPITAWAAWLADCDSVAISHQASFLSDKTPRPLQSNYFAELIFHKFAPCKRMVGFHYKKYDDFIHLPVIKNSLRELPVDNRGHITVYLPSHDDKILLGHFSRIRERQWQVFTKSVHEKTVAGNVTFCPISSDGFAQSMSMADGVVCSAGFETPSEALYLGKKLMVIPMKGQYEQKCNGEALNRMGVRVIDEVTSLFPQQIRHWLEHQPAIKQEYPDTLAETVAGIIDIRERSTACYNPTNSLPVT